MAVVCNCFEWRRNRHRENYVTHQGNRFSIKGSKTTQTRETERCYQWEWNRKFKWDKKGRGSMLLNRMCWEWMDTIWDDKICWRVLKAKKTLPRELSFRSIVFYFIHRFLYFYKHKACSTTLTSWFVNTK